MFKQINLWAIIIIRSMSKTTHNKYKKQDYDFMMEPTASNNRKYYKNKVKLNLKTIIKKYGKKKLQRCNPIFNTDGLPYTPAFILESDKEIYEILGDILKNQYLQKILKTEELSTNFMDASGPNFNLNGECKICFVCKDRYLNYEEHINQAKHKQNVKKSDYSYHIQSLCEQYSGSTFDNSEDQFQHQKDLQKYQKLQQVSLLYGDRYYQELPRLPYRSDPDNLFQQSQRIY